VTVTLNIVLEDVFPAGENWLIVYKCTLITDCPLGHKMGNEAGIFSRQHVEDVKVLSLMTHPALLSEDLLLKECRVRALRRGGPGGQHRNKVETAIVVEHEPSGIRAEANERRCQKENKAVAIFRLRLELAVHIRSQWVAEFTKKWSSQAEYSQAEYVDSTCPNVALTTAWQSRIKKGRISIASDHWDFPAVLAEAMDQLLAQSGNVTAAAKCLEISPSQLVKLLRMHAPALSLVNKYRQERGWNSLR
jgi:hypothetical protein